MSQWQRCKRNPQPTSTFHQILPNQYNAKQNLDCWGKNNTFKITLEIELKIKIRFCPAFRLFNPSSFCIFFNCRVVCLDGVLCGTDMFKKTVLVAGDHRGKKRKCFSCNLLVSLQRQFPALQPSPAYLQQSLAQGNRIVLLEGDGGLSFADGTSVWFCGSYKLFGSAQKAKIRLVV